MQRSPEQGDPGGVGLALLVIVWHLLSDPDSRYHDLGSDFYDNWLGPDRKNAPTSANSKPSVSRSPSNPPLKLTIARPRPGTA